MIIHSQIGQLREKMLQKSSKTKKTYPLIGFKEK
jgi:hypothetical protein